MMKKLFSLTLAMVTALGLMLPASAAEETTDEALARVTQAVKAALDLDTDAYDEFQGSWYEDGLTGAWDLYWSTELEEELSISALDDGTVISYDLGLPYTASNSGDFPVFPQGDEAAAARAAGDFLDKVLREGESVKLEEPRGMDILGGDSYRYSGVILLNGLPSPLTYSITVDAADNRVRSFHRTTAEDTFLGDVPSAAAAVRRDRAAKLLTDTLELKLEQLYRKWGISDKADFSAMGPEDWPIAEDLYAVLEDAYEHITHSLCTLEFENHRPLYNWVVENVSVPNHPRQIEFARLGIDHTVLSKRKLRALIEGGYVSGWDDPRMPTLCGLRRRGYTPASIRNFCESVGVAKSPNTIEYAFLESCLRKDLDATAQRVMAVLKPVKLTITNYPAGQSETFEIENNPNNPADGNRTITFSRDLWIEADDFMAQPIPKYKRLYPDGPECRLKGAYVIQCTGCVTDDNGNVTEVLATYDPESKGGDPADGRKIKGATIHWVDANNCHDAEVRQYSNLFNDPDPDAAGKDFIACLNPDSLEVLTGCKVEASLGSAKAPTSYQFMRLGYFCPDSRDCTPEHLVFNRSVSLKDSFKSAK